MVPDPEQTEPGKLSQRILANLPRLTRFIRQRMSPELRARESASDIVQSTVRSLLQREAPFEDRGEASFQAWLRTAARNKLSSRSRHWGAARRNEAAQPNGNDPRQGAEDEALASDSVDPSRATELREEVDRLRRAFAKLTPEQRELLIRSQVDGASHAEIARESGCTPNAVRKSVARALAQLAASLEP